ncbi:hypothetical protein AAE026_29380 [Bradyrhizobium sp. DN5]|uniref:hypothetical protein n=1 Tax=Bradyrhizobium sp. DN5 TaxID=3056950 RepID=UPI0035251950
MAGAPTWPLWPGGVRYVQSESLKAIRLFLAGEYPPEISGKLPEGFVLEGQPIEILCFWHRKAIEVIDHLPNVGLKVCPRATDERLDFYCGIKNRILGAILSARGDVGAGGCPAQGSSR